MNDTLNVKMNVTMEDAVNAEYIENALHCKNKAQAISCSLSITKSLIDKIKAGGKLHMEKDGIIEILILTGLS